MVPIDSAPSFKSQPPDHYNTGVLYIEELQRNEVYSFSAARFSSYRVIPRPIVRNRRHLQERLLTTKDS